MNRILYLEAATLTLNHTDISLLAAHGAVEWSLLHDNRTGLSVSQSLNQLILSRQNRYLGIVNQSVITYELGSDLSRNGLIYSDISTHVVGSLTSRTSLLTLLLHSCLETFLVNGEILLLQNLQSQI